MPQVCDATEEDDELEPCYCLNCNWQGMEDELFEDIVQQLSVCPQCHASDIVFY